MCVSQVGYVVVQYGEAILVSCAGQSIYIEGNDTKNGSQFQFDTSRGRPDVNVPLITLCLGTKVQDPQPWF